MTTSLSAGLDLRDLTSNQRSHIAHRLCNYGCPGAYEASALASVIWSRHDEFIPASLIDENPAAWLALLAVLREIDVITRMFCRHAFPLREDAEHLDREMKRERRSVSARKGATS